MPFRDREDGGRQLAAALRRFGAERPVVVALPRGGVPVGDAVARALSAPLDVLPVIALRAPGAPGPAVGAIAPGGVWLDEPRLRALDLRPDAAAELASVAARELSRRRLRYRDARPPEDLRDRTVLLVDDGVVSGATARAAARAARAGGAAWVVLAAPLIPWSVVPGLREELDEVVAVELPFEPVPLSAAYRRFPRVSDDEVCQLLRRNGVAQALAAADGGELLGPWSEGAEPPPASPEERPLTLPMSGLGCGRAGLDGTLGLPDAAHGLVVFVHGAGATHADRRERQVAQLLRGAGLATLLFDLLTPEERVEDEATLQLRFDLDLLAGRLGQAVRWIRRLPGLAELPLGLLGASTGGAAALSAAAALPEVRAVVARGGRPDLLAPELLRRIGAAVLLLVGGRDEMVLSLNRSALTDLPDARLAVIPGAGHLFEEPGALAAAARLAAEWFDHHLPTRPELQPAG